jgi:hypothetical protein
MLFERSEEQVAELRFDTHPIDRSRSQGTPDFLHPAALQYQDATGEPTAQVLVALDPWSSRRLINTFEQLGGQAALQTNRCFGPITQVVVVRGEQVAPLMEMLEVAISILLRPFLSSASGAQPDNVMHVVGPGDTSVVRHTNAVDKRMVDGEDPLLAPRRCRPEPTNLLQQRMVDLTTIDVEAWELDAEVIDQTANSRLSATRSRHCQVYAADHGAPAGIPDATSRREALTEGHQDLSFLGG